MNTTWLMENASTSWLMGVALLAALVVWVVVRATRKGEGTAILYTGIAMGLVQLAVAAWIVIWGR